MSIAKQIRRLVEQLKDSTEDGLDIGAWLTLRDGSYGVAFFVMKYPAVAETLVEFDLLNLAEKLEGDK